MKKKTIVFILLMAALVSVGAFWFIGKAGHDHGAAPATEEEKTLYTCGMHPQVIQDHPGNCPICGMKLTPIRRPSGVARKTPSSGERAVKYYKSTMIPGEVNPVPGKDSMGMDMVPVYEDETAAETAIISIDPVTIQNMGIRTGVVSQGPLRRTIRTVGIIDYDETALADVTTKFKGWVEKLYVNATGEQVHRGEPLFEIYSPELYSAQVEYLLALRASETGGLTSSSPLRASARLKLKYYDVSDEQIAELEKTREPRKTLRAAAPIDGFVIEKMVVEGQMVEAGMNMYRLANLGLVWVYAQIYEQDLGFIQLGQEALVRLSYLPDRHFRGRVTYIYPTLDEKTRTAKVRMEFHNPGFFLKPGMFASVELRVELEPAAVLVPDMAVLRSGDKNTVFVALEGGRFEPRTVELGLSAENDMYQVLSGLREGERVVTSGQFMLDSESQLREAIQKMLHPRGSEKMADRAAPMQEPSGHAAAAHTTAEEAGAVTYVCPMPEHVSIQYKRPGACPLCGMDLVPVTTETLPQVQTAGRLLYYTCPMPEHSHVRVDKPGKCPLCSMTLIPVMTTPKPVAPAAAKEPSAPKLYTCPMSSHAHVVSDKPGRCPECNMELVETGTVKHGKIAEENWRKQHPFDQPAAPQH